MGENFSANYFAQWKFCHTGTFTRGCQAVLVVPHDHQPAVLPGVQNLFFLDLQPSLMLLLSYFHVAPWVCPILRDPFRRSYSLPPSQRPTLLWTACSKLRPRKLKSERSIVPRIVRTVHVRTIFGPGPGRGVFIRELHPLLPSEQPALWVKLNSAKFLCQYKVWAWSEIFVQWKFCAIRYNVIHTKFHKSNVCLVTSVIE